VKDSPLVAAVRTLETSRPAIAPALLALVKALAIPEPRDRSRTRGPRLPAEPGPTMLNIPDVCHVGDLVRILKISRATIDRRRAFGSFPIPELPAMDKRPRWSGAVVQRFLESGQTGRALLQR
jgi:hypothetical protein